MDWEVRRSIRVRRASSRYKRSNSTVTRDICHSATVILKTFLFYFAGAQNLPLLIRGRLDVLEARFAIEEAVYTSTRHAYCWSLSFSSGRSWKVSSDYHDFVGCQCDTCGGQSSADGLLCCACSFQLQGTKELKSCMSNSTAFCPWKFECRNTKSIGGFRWSYWSWVH